MTQKITQHPQEIEKLLDWAAGSKSILEIGSKAGWTLAKLGNLPGVERIVAVDLPGCGEWGKAGTGDALIKVADALGATLFLANSQHEETVEKVRQYGPYDFIFIDADHSYEGVKKDWENYGPMGKKVAFHDILKPPIGTNQNLQVWMLWEEIKKTHKWEEFYGEQTLMGIGLVCK